MNSLWVFGGGETDSGPCIASRRKTQYDCEAEVQQLFAGSKAIGMGVGRCYHAPVVAQEI